MAQSMPLHSIDTARNQLAKIMRSYRRGNEIDATKFRNLVYGFSTLLQYFKAGELAEIERRLDELEDKTGTETVRVMERRKK